MGNGVDGSAHGDGGTEVRTHSYRYRRLLETTCRVNSEHDVDDLLRYLTEQAADLTDADRATIFLTEPAEKELQARIALKAELPLRVPAGKGIAGHVCQTGESVLLADAYTDPRFNPEMDRRTGYRTRGLLCVPIRHRYRTPIGVFQVLNKRTGDFDEADVDILLGLGAHASVALDQMQAWAERDRVMNRLVDSQKELTARLGQLDILYELEMALNRNTEMEAFLHAVMVKLMSSFESEGTSLLMQQPSGLGLYFVSAIGAGAERLQHVSLRPGEGIASWVFEHGDPLLCSDPERDSRFTRRIDEATGFKTRNILCVPVSTEMRRIGALEFCNRRGAAYRMEDLRSAELIARHLGILLTRRLEQEERLQRGRMETLGAIVQGIAHDLRAPLGNLLFSANMLKAPDIEASLANRLGDLFDRQVRRCISMTDDILDFSRGDFKYTFQPVLVRTLLEELRETVLSELADRKIELLMDPPADIHVFADGPRVGRVFTNIVMNAAKAIGSGGTIRITAGPIDSQVHFTFEDTGPGIPKDIQARIFEPFVSSSSSTGLGLAIARRILHDHDGQISFDADAGPGARFHVTIPIAPVASAG